MAPYRLAPVAFQRIVAEFRLQPGAKDTIGALGLGDRLHSVGEFRIGRRHLDPVLIQQVLAVHQDEDRDIEGYAHPFAIDQRPAFNQRTAEVVEVEIRHREFRLVLVELDRIDAVLREGRDP